MAGETPRGENGNGLTVWKPVKDLLSQLDTAGVSSANLRGNPLERHLALRQNAASEQAKEQLRGFVPGTDIKYVIDCTGSMSDDRGPVQKDLPMFLNTAIAQAFGTIPAEIQQQISPKREIRWTRINFGDGTPKGGRGYGQGDFVPRWDVPYLTVSSGSEQTDRNDLKAGALHATEQFRTYHNHMYGGGNEGESSAEALLAAFNLTPQYAAQLQLLQRLLSDCQTLQGRSDSGFGSRYPFDAGSTGTDIVPYLQDLIAGKLIPPLFQQTPDEGGSDMLFLITDEPAIGSIVSLEEVKALRLKHGFFAIITPNDRIGRYWQSHAQELGAQWFDLNSLTGASANMNGMNFAQEQIAKAIQKQVVTTVASDLKQTLLQLTDGKGPVRPGTIIRT